MGYEEIISKIDEYMFSQNDNTSVEESDYSDLRVTFIINNVSLCGIRFELDGGWVVPYTAIDSILSLEYPPESHGRRIPLDIFKKHSVWYKEVAEPYITLNDMR